MTFVDGKEILLPSCSVLMVKLQHAERVADGRGTATPMIQTARGRTGFWASFQDPTYGPVLKLAIYTAVIAVTQGFVG